MGIVFLNCQQLEKQTPHLLPLCVHPLPRQGETRDNERLITHHKRLKVAHREREPSGIPETTAKVAKVLYTSSSNSNR